MAKETKIAYVCSTTWQHEFETTWVKIYPSEKSLLANCGCIEDGGEYPCSAVKLTFEVDDAD